MTVRPIASRAGYCLLFQHRALELIGPPPEPVVFDHFETFAFSQLERLGVATPVGHRSWFAYGFEAAPHAGGSRRAARKRPLRSPRTPHRAGSVAHSVRAMLERLAFPGAALDLYSDDHPAYRPAIAGHPLSAQLRHSVFANPPRRTATERARARVRDRAMFPVDQLHRLLRHSQAHHRRETIAFGRRSNALMERIATFTVWRNFIKLLTERRPERSTPAMVLGVTRQRFDWPAVFARRLFPDRRRLSASWTAIYRRELTTPAVGRNLRHRLRTASCAPL